MRRLLLAVICSAIMTPLFSQMAFGDFNQKFLEANQLMEEKLWDKSIALWEELYQTDSNNANVNYKLGYCYLQSANNKLKALPYLQNAASQKMAKKYDPYEPIETKAPIEAIYYYGHALHLNYQMDDAIVQFNRLLEKISEKHILRREANHRIAQCHQAKIQVNNPQNYLISNVGPIVNSEYNDFGPVISLDERSLFFTSRRLRPDSSNELLTEFDTGEYREDVYASYKDKNGNWMIPELLNINTDQHAASISVSPDGQTLYIYYDNDGDGQLWSSKLIGETWSVPEMLGSDINSDAWETHVTVSADGRELYFTSNREGGSGGRDIYRCVKLPNNEWSKALNIGERINTEWEEDSPFLSADGNTLYFASSGHTSMGGFDIFYTTKGADGEWGEPQNIGYPVNTVDDDVFFFPTANGKRAYYASDRDEGFGLKDIYLIDMPDSPVESDLAVLKGFVYPAEGDPIPEDLYIMVMNKQTGEVTEYRPRSRDGAYVAILPPCDSYQIDYILGEKVLQQELINVPCESAFRVIEKEIYLLPLHLGGDTETAVAEVENTTKPTDPDPTDPDPTDPDPIDPKSGNAKNGTTSYLSLFSVGTAYENGEAYFQRYFIYDFHEFEKREQKFAEFIANIEMVISEKGKATILVESSASRVPSSRFNSNKDLTAFRNKTARDKVETALKEKGYTLEKDFEFGKTRELVQGPKYENDAQKNKSTYEQFQYIKIWAY
jgi:hypothetical protein